MLKSGSLELSLKVLEHDEVIAASELINSGSFLDILLGKDLNEDVLDEIFSKFCIGK